MAEFAALPGQPTDADGPIFAEPWQAEALALVVQLHQTGRFTWSEWAQTLADVLKEVAAGGEPDDGTRYYTHWLVALERIATAKHLVGADELDERKQAWEAAYLNTPHGQPVELLRASRQDRSGTRV